MNRNFFTFFGIFFCFCMQVKAQQPLIEMVSVDTASEIITISWRFTDGIDSAIQLTIYQCSGNCNVENFIKPYEKVIHSDLAWQDTIANFSIPNYYCIGWENSRKSPPHWNMVLKAEVQSGGCPNSVTLSWNPYINMKDSLEEYHILYKSDMDTIFKPCKTIQGTDYFVDYDSQGKYSYPTERLSYEVKELTPMTSYEFLIEATNKTKTVSAFSNIAKITTKDLDTTHVQVIITQVSVFQNEEFKDIGIEIKGTVDNFTDSSGYLYLLRGIDTKNYNIIDSLKNDLGYLFHFKDESVNPSSILYYYMAIAENKCKPNDTSNILTNILLKGGRVEKYNDTINFVQRGFNEFNPPEPYEVFRLVNDKISYPITDDLIIRSSVSDLTTRSCNYFVDVLPYMDDGTNPTYRIEASDGSLSNTLTIGHEPVISFPNAFYPQSIHIENRTFYPIIKFPSKDNYLFLIYNRWGQEVYRSTLPPVYGDYENMEGRWNGTFNGKDSPAGIYAFKIVFNSEGSGNYTESGTFMLVR